MTEGHVLRRLYERRFRSQERSRNDMWQVLCREFFQRWVPRDATVVDLAAGHCEFINAIVAETRIAVDLNPAVVHYAAPGVRPVICDSTDLHELPTGSIDRVFVSNFFEHIGRSEILATLDEARRVLRPNGKLLVLQPNIRYCARDYWMFFDHITPIDDRALQEACELQGFRIDLCIPRFLPFTTQSRVPADPRLVRLYLRVPVAWRVMGGQAFLVASPT